MLTSTRFPQCKDGFVSEVECIQLNTILNYANIKHVNFFILDVEGGELSVLKGIDWDNVTFDVLCIETDVRMRPDGYIDEVKAYMAARDYTLYADRGRNSYFTHRLFVKSSRAGIDADHWTGKCQPILK